MNNEKTKLAFELNKEMESQTKIKNAVLLVPSFIPRKKYHEIGESLKKKIGEWYNYSSTRLSLTKRTEKHSAEIILWIVSILFGGIALWALEWAIKNKDKFLAIVDRLKAPIPIFNKITYEQSYFIRKTFGKTKPLVHGLIGSDERRHLPERKIPILYDKFGKAEELQMDEFGKDLLMILVSNVLFGKGEVEVGMDNMEAINRVRRANILSSGGPVPNFFTEKSLEKVKEINFDLTDGLYPLRTKLNPKGLKPEYDESEGIYYTDYGVILWQKYNPYNARYSSLCIFGCHGYGTVAAARAITDYKHGRIEVEKDILDDIVVTIDKGVNSFYVVVKAKLGWINGNWDITKIELEEGPIRIE